MGIFLHSQKLLSMNSLIFQMYNILKMYKEVAYNSGIPHSPCLYEVGESASLLAKGINSSLKSSDVLSPTAHDLVETHTCDSSSKDYMLVNCPEYLKPGLSLPDFKADIDLISFLQWQRVEKKIVKVNQTMPFGQVICKWVETMSNLKKHNTENVSKLPVIINEKMS